ncbi:glutathione S-transferase [Pisolithus croceorrhizus]|nr:glutathione S-transferase [Pisolithus croceorrhizus]
MVVKIYGHAVAPTVRLVAEVCKEKGIPYELVPIAVYKGEHKTPAFKQFQPFGQDDDGFILYESRAICRYLAKKYEEQGGIESKQSNFHPFVSGLAFEKIIKKHQGMETDETKVKVLLDNLNAKLSAYEPYLAGEYITLADLFHLPYGTVAIEELGCDVLQDRPNVARWWKEISSRPAWQAVKNGA